MKNSEERVLRKNQIKIRGDRLARLRIEKGLSQKQFADVFSNYIGKSEKLALATVSAWETGLRSPRTNTLSLLAEYFNVSVDYLLGKTSIRNKNGKESKRKEPLSPRDSIFYIPIKQLRKYHKFPIFVQFKDLAYENQWGIFDAENYTITFVNTTLKVDEINGDFFTYPRPSDMYAGIYNSRPYNISELMKCRNIWIEIKSNDDKLKGEYNGWYKHNENNTGLVNLSNGLTLPYTGIGLSYKAYSGPFEHKVKI